MGKPNRNRKNANTGDKSKSGEKRDDERPRCVLTYKPSQPNATTITVKFKDADASEVKETLNIWRDGDPKDQLINLQKRIFWTLANQYDYYKDGRAQMLSQTYGRALAGSCEEKWNVIEETIADFKGAQIQATVRKRLQKHAAQVIGKKAFEKQQDAIEEGMPKQRGMTLTTRIERLYQISTLI